MENPDLAGSVRPNCIKHHGIYAQEMPGTIVHVGLSFALGVVNDFSTRQSMMLWCSELREAHTLTLFSDTWA